MASINELQSSYSNVPDSVMGLLDRKLHKQENHPICIIKNAIYEYFKRSAEFGKEVKTHDDLPNIVTTRANFDDLLIPPDHPSRSKSDTYYVDETHVLRSQTSAHQCELLSAGQRTFLVTGDVYRKDEIDRCHYNVFHQMEGVFVLSGTTHDDVATAETCLKRTLSGLVEHLFPGCEYRFNVDSFPFTEPSFEVEVKFGGRWLEILGCGVIHRTILKRLGIEEIGFAFGVGLERMAMILFGINDIRLFWTQSPKFVQQFDASKDFRTIRFKPYSKLDATSRDISFFIPAVQLEDGEGLKWSAENDFYELIRETCRDSIEHVSPIDKFYNKKLDKYSRTYRLTFSPNSDMTNPADFSAFVNGCMDRIGKSVSVLGVEPRFSIK